MKRVLAELKKGQYVTAVESRDVAVTTGKKYRLRGVCGDVDEAVSGYIYKGGANIKLDNGKIAYIILSQDCAYGIWK